MREVLSFFTFSIGALFFVLFFSTLKPATVIAVPGPSMGRALQHESFATARLPAALFAAVSWSDVGPRH
jgi:hypothetical protein